MTARISAAVTGEDPGLASELPVEVQKDELPRALFGYDRSTVGELLDTMSARIRTLVHQRAERDRRIDELERELGRSREDQRLIGETFVKAREQAVAVREEARRSAEKYLRSARKQADRIVADAEEAAAAKAKQLVESAHDQRRKLIEGAAEERQALLDEAGRARAFVDQTHEQLSDFLLAAVRWYEQAKPSGELGAQASGDQPDSAANERSSMPPSWTAALTRESQSTSSSTGLSDE